VSADRPALAASLAPALDRPVLLVVGPTAVGKSAQALTLAERLDGEIVSLDSRQMVVGLDIGTAKPTAAERARVRHHLVDVAEADAPLPLSAVLDLVDLAVADIRARGRTALLVGGTGQYVRAIREGWQVPEVPPDPSLRAELSALAAAAGPPALHARLAALDPAAAGRIDPRNVRRVVRALEVQAQLGPQSTERAAGPRYSLAIAGLSRPRPTLYARADARLAAMVAAGLEDEVRGLVARGLGWELPAMSSVGYREWRAYLAGRIEAEEVLRLIRHNTRVLIRKQATWMRSDDPEITWFDLEQPGAEAALARWAEAALGGAAV
jgi:tRNA dimethylallyltransferase